MKIAVVGSGSAAEQHYRAALSLGFAAALVSLKTIDRFKKFTDVMECETLFKPDYYIIANTTNQHFTTYQEIREINKSVPILCEKPFNFPSVTLDDKELRIGLNLRFSSVIMYLYENRNLFLGKVNSVSIEYGRDLRTWRKDGLRQDSYSRFHELGGGVLRDLCHEIDFLLFLFGRPKHLISIGGSFTDLTVNSADLFEIFFSSENYDVARVHLDCLSPIPYRQIRFVGKDIYMKADLLKNTIEINRKSIKLKNANTFKSQMQDMVAGTINLADSNHGNYLDYLLRSIEESNDCRKWITLRS